MSGSSSSAAAAPSGEGGRRWKERRVRKIADKVFDRLTEDAQKHEKEAFTFEGVNAAVICVYNDINKYLPGPHRNPPSKEKLQVMMEEYDVYLDGLLDREEFILKLAITLAML